MDSHWKKVIIDLRVPIHILNMPGAHSVACGVLVKAGTRDERWPEEAGLAHALEHMLFQGTRDFPDIFSLTSYLEDVGGIIDAGTEGENTFVYNRAPAKEIERSIHVLSQQLMHPRFNEEKIKSEMQNIIQEIRMDNDDVEEYVKELSKKKAYGNHPLGRSILGTEKSVSGFERRHFVNFHSYYYNANNFDFIVAGRIESENQVADLFRKYFAGLPDGPLNTREAIEFAEGRDNFGFENRDLEQVHIVMRKLTVKGGSREATLIDIFRVMIGDGLSFPLFTEVRDKLGLCYKIQSGHELYSDLSNFVIYLGTDPKRYKEAVEAVFKTLQKSKNDAKLLAKAQGRISGLIAFQRENPMRVLDFAANDISLIERPRDHDEIVKTINEITLSEIESVVDQYLLYNPYDNFTFVYLAPNDLFPTQQLDLGPRPSAADFFENLFNA